MNERFWENLETIVFDRDLSWADLARKMFQGQYVYPSEFNRLYQTFRHYKSHRLMPQVRWVERLVVVLEIDYEDLFRR
ncbi:transcriptional regulator [Streptococcus jiangjianxini]|uniref:transcriptional regulator n=1 Tax=Streptococcus jiangjianxini TaxID=3161189 RepID=UPI0032ECEA28